MKKLCLYLLLAFSGLSVVSCHHSPEETHENSPIYTCPMHPLIREQGPGICPICKMDLVPVGSRSDSKEIALSPAQEKLAGIQLISMDSLSKSEAMRIPARLEANHEATYWITLKLPGRIDWLLTREAGTTIRKGAVVARVYSETFESLQRELLLNLAQKEQFPNEARFGLLLEKSIRKMELYEVSPAQIKALLQKRKTLPYLEVLARREGVAQEIKAAQGSYLEAGAPIMILEDYSSLLAEATASPALLRNLEEGQSTDVLLRDGRVLQGHIHQVLPELGADNNGRFLVMIPKAFPGMLPGQSVQVSLPAGGTSGIWVPAAAVVRGEKENWVWIYSGNGHYKPQKVELGAETSSQVQILSGITGTERLVGKGSYLLYSEMKLQHAH